MAILSVRSSHIVRRESRELTELEDYEQYMQELFRGGQKAKETYDSCAKKLSEARKKAAVPFVEKDQKGAFGSEFSGYPI